MKQLGKFLSLSTGERRLLVSAVFYLVATRVALWLVPFGEIFKRSSAVAVARDQNNSLPPQRIAWAIRVASRYLAGTGSCLVQSLAAQTMLARRGYSSHLRIGVAKDKGGRLKAHAWVECEGKIVIGGRGVSQYAALPRWEVQR